MKTVLYLDILLLVNFLAGFCLLQAVSFLCNAQILWWRALAASVVAALSTLLMLAPSLPSGVSFLCKIAAAFLIVFVAFGYKHWRPFLRCWLWFFLLNLGLAGVVFLAIAQGSNGLYLHNLNIYANLSPTVLVFCIVSVYLLLRLLSLLFGTPQPHNIVALQLTFGESALVLQGFHDTGFFLRDPIHGKQAILVSFPAAKEKLPLELACFLEAFFAGEPPLFPAAFLGFRILPCTSIAGCSTLPAFVASRATLTKNKQQWQAEKVLVAFAPTVLGDGQFDALLGSEFLLNETKGRKHLCTPN